MITLIAGDSTAEIRPDVGGRLGQIDLGCGQLLRGPANDLGWSEWGCYPLLPWSNRLPGGRLRYGDLRADLPVNHPDGSAIHGLAASCPWTVDHHDEVSASLSVDAQGGPYRVRGHLDYALSPGALDLVLRTTNLGERTVPVGIGIHPWFRSGPVRVPAELVWPGEPMSTGPRVPVSGHHDLREPAMPEPMDACFTGLAATSVDVPGARLHWQGPVTHVVVYSGQPGWVCVEPVTMANDGIAMADRGEDGHGVQPLAPGTEIEVRYRFERATNPR